MSLKKQLEKKFSDLQFSAHESDLYVLPPDTKINEVMLFIKQKKWSPSMCYSDVEGQDWFGKYFVDVPFANASYWKKRGMRTWIAYLWRGGVNTEWIIHAESYQEAVSMFGIQPPGYIWHIEEK